MHKILPTLIFFVASITSAYSVSIDGASCAAIRYDKPRLTCFDKAAKDVIEGKAKPSSTPATSFDSSSCIILFDETERLICFDKATDQAGRSSKDKAPEIVKQEPQKPELPAKIEIAREVEKAELAKARAEKEEAERRETEIKARTKVIDPRDVRNTPDKWQDRKLQFNRANVYWVEDNDVRILLPGPGNMTLFAINVIGPPEAIEYFKRECETSKEAFSNKCRAAVRFSYFMHSTDKPDGYSTRTILITKDLEFIRVQPPRRRR